MTSIGASQIFNEQLEIIIKTLTLSEEIKQNARAVMAFPTGSYSNRHV